MFPNWVAQPVRRHQAEANRFTNLQWQDSPNAECGQHADGPQVRFIYKVAIAVGKVAAALPLLASFRRDFMNLSAPFIRRPVATTLLSFGLVVAGIVAFFKLPVSPLPDVDIPTISVQATLPGASGELARH